MGWWRDHFGTFGLWRRSKPDMIEDPRGTYLEDFSTSTEEFYSAIEEELTTRKFPELTVTREFFREGGPLSAQREYLRMRRERLIFDICAAPFGTSFIFPSVSRKSRSFSMSGSSSSFASCSTQSSAFIGSSWAFTGAL
jgi:hypothetical protein